jgi:hypothetical protein
VNATPIDIASLLGPDADPGEAGLTLRQVGAASADRATELFDDLLENADQIPLSDPAILGGLLRGLHILFLKGDPAALAALDPARFDALADALPANCPNRHLVDHLIVMIGSDAALRSAVRRMITHPPKDSAAAGQILAPLLQRKSWPVEAVFPALLDAIENRFLASPILDIANYLTRTRRVATHPAAERAGWLTSLLAAVTGRLEQFESDPRSLGDDIASVQQRLAEAVSLAVSLCDALGLVGWTPAIPRLTEAMQLKHRRVQTEAAGALARLGDEVGAEHLVALVAEPSARLRVIAYADELGLGEKIDEHYRGLESTAEAEMALWLSQPGQMGVAPTLVESIDHRVLYWPGYEQPLDCFLVRFHYDMGAKTYSNVGIAGPVTFALANNVADLPIDDIYAIYAGWQAEHDDIFAIAAEHLNPAQRRLVSDLAAHADRAGYHRPAVELFGVFLDEHAAVFRAVRDEKPCFVITDGLEMVHLPIGDRPRELGAVDLWNLYKGRKMLRTFNPVDSPDDVS